LAGDSYTGSLIVPTFGNYIHSEPRFRALLTEGDARALFHREGFGQLGKVSA
jgi:hypothetical protein